MPQVTIRTPPTAFVTHGPLLTFDLPLVPKPSYAAGIALLLFYGLVHAFLIWWIIGTPVSTLMAGIGDGTWTGGQLAFTLIFGGLVIALMSPSIEATLTLAIAVFSRRPVIEIRPEGLIDRRMLKRMVRWDEFESVHQRQHVTEQLRGGIGYSFRLKDKRLRRFSPSSALHSLWFGGKRVAINSSGFDLPPLVILDVILAMIRNNQGNSPAG